LKLLSEKEGLNMLNLDLDRNIFRLKSDDLIHTLLKSSLIECAIVKKIFPNSILIEVTEKRPYMQFNYQGQYYIYDEYFSRLIVQNKPLPNYFSFEVYSKCENFDKLFADKDSREDFRNFLITIAADNLYIDNFVLMADDSKNLFLTSKFKNLTIEMGCGDLCNNYKKFAKFVSKNGLQNLDNMIIDNRFKDMIIVKKIQ
jgi:hypothetical protein